MSGENKDGTPKKQSGLALVAWIAIGLAIFIYAKNRPESFNKKNEIAESQISICLNKDSKLSDDEFEEDCEGKSFSASAYPINCYIKSDCELSTKHPKDPTFDRNLNFKANLKTELPLHTEKLNIQAVIIDRSFFGTVAVDISKQQPVELSTTELQNISEWSKPKPSPESAAKMWLNEKENDNRRMMSYAEKNHAELSKKARKVVVDENAIPNMAEWRYYMPEGKVISCLRGFEGSTFRYNCDTY